MTADCTLSILVARTDTSFMMNNIPHLVRMCNFPFKERVLVVDTAPLARRYKKLPHVGTLDQLYNLCNQLKNEGFIDKIVNINYQKDYRKKIYAKWFDKDMWQTHDYRGYPILGSIFPIEESRTDYLVHFDSDMLLYQHPNYNWIEEAIQLMEKYPDSIFAEPLAGAPGENWKYVDGPPDEDWKDIKKDTYIYRRKWFASRVFLVKCKHLEHLLPLLIPPLKVKLPLKSRIRDFLSFTRTNTIPPWEDMIEASLKNSQYNKLDVISTNAWTLHPNERSQKYFEELPKLIKRIESGYYPPQQTGDYDLRLESWL